MYYLLLNEVELKEFSLGKMIISGKQNTSIASQTETILKKWSILLLYLG